MFVIYSRKLAAEVSWKQRNVSTHNHNSSYPRGPAAKNALSISRPLMRTYTPPPSLPITLASVTYSEPLG